MEVLLKVALELKLGDLVTMTLELRVGPWLQ